MKQWWIALCPSGKISEICEDTACGDNPPMMLPPCSNQDLPTWIAVVPKHPEIFEKLPEMTVKDK